MSSFNPSTSYAPFLINSNALPRFPTSPPYICIFWDNSIAFAGSHRFSANLIAPISCIDEFKLLASIAILVNPSIPFENPIDSTDLRLALISVKTSFVSRPDCLASFAVFCSISKDSFCVIPILTKLEYAVFNSWFDIPVALPNSIKFSNIFSDGVIALPNEVPTPAAISVTSLKLAPTFCVLMYASVSLSLNSFAPTTTPSVSPF